MLPMTTPSARSPPENRVEDVYREALADLFGGARGHQARGQDAKAAQVYRHLSNAADRGTGANVIADIVVKIA